LFVSQPAAALVSIANIRLVTRRIARA